MENDAEIAPIEATVEKQSVSKRVVAWALNAARKIWEIPAVQSVALTWLIRAGASSTVAGIVIAIVEALSGIGF